MSNPTVNLNIQYVTDETKTLYKTFHKKLYYLTWQPDNYVTTNILRRLQRPREV